MPGSWSPALFCHQCLQPHHEFFVGLILSMIKSKPQTHQHLMLKKNDANSKRDKSASIIIHQIFIANKIETFSQMVQYVKILTIQFNPTCS